MKRIITAAVLTLTAITSNAACYGGANVYSCSDASGNTYNVQRYGNTTSVQGYNSNTGNSWSQQSYQYGNQTHMPIEQTIQNQIKQQQIEQQILRHGAGGCTPNFATGGCL